MRSLRQSTLELNTNSSLRNTSLHLKTGEPLSLAALVAARKIDSHHEKVGGIHSDYGIATPGYALQRSLPKFTRYFRGGSLLYDYVEDKTNAIFTWECRIRFQGVKCFEETDELSATDEIYAITTVYNPDLIKEMRPQARREPSDNTDSAWDLNEGEVAESIKTIWVGPPEPIVIHVVLWEHDEGSPEEIRQEMQQFADDLSKITQDESPSKLVSLLKTTFIGDWIAALLALGDNPVGEDKLQILAQDWYDIIGHPEGWDKIDDASIKANLDKKFPLRYVNGLKYRLETNRIKGLGGEFKAYFDIVVQRVGIPIE